MWQKQLISIVEGNSLDPDHIADFLVTYEAETRDESLRGCGVEVLMFMGALRPWSASWSRFRSGSRFNSRSVSWSKSRSKSRSRSKSGFRSWTRSVSRSRSRSESGSWSRSWSGLV
jgi:hypothetical protein